MTVLAVLRDNVELAYGCDGLIVTENHVNSYVADKWFIKGNWRFGISGYWHTSYLLRQKLKTKKSDSIHSIVAQISKILAAAGYFEERRNGPKTTDDEMIIISDKSEIYHLGSDLTPIDAYSVREYKFACAGSGAFYANASIHSLIEENSSLTNKAIVERAIYTACYFDRTCGGTVTLKEIKHGTPSVS